MLLDMQPSKEELRHRKTEHQRRRRAENPMAYKEINRATNRRLRFKRYGMTEEVFNDIVARQGGVCAICRNASDRLCIDHDHGCCPVPRKQTQYVCGKCVRGVICSECNLGLSKFKDDPTIIAAAAAYLEQHEVINHGD